MISLKHYGARWNDCTGYHPGRVSSAPATRTRLHVVLPQMGKAHDNSLLLDRAFRCSRSYFSNETVRASLRLLRLFSAQQRHLQKMIPGLHPATGLRYRCRHTGMGRRSGGRGGPGAAAEECQRRLCFLSSGSACVFDGGAARMFMAMGCGMARMSAWPDRRKRSASSGFLVPANLFHG